MEGLTDVKILDLYERYRAAFKRVERMPYWVKPAVLELSFAYLRALSNQIKQVEKALRNARGPAGNYDPIATIPDGC